jgi:hypothetical protein
LKDINTPWRVGIICEGAYGNYLKSIIDCREKYETGLVIEKAYDAKGMPGKPSGGKFWGTRMLMWYILPARIICMTWKPARR